MLAREGKKLPESEIEDIFCEISPFLDKQGRLTFEKFTDIMSNGVYHTVL